MDILEKVLRDTLDKLETTNEISVSEVMNLEDTVSSINADYKGFITNECPLHKFTTVPTPTNVDAVKLSTRTLLDNVISINKNLNENALSIRYKTIETWTDILEDIKDNIKNLVSIPTVVMEQLSNFKYVAHLEDDTFKDLGTDVPFIEALVKTDLKDIFKIDSRDLPIETESVNDKLYGLIRPLLTMDDTDNITESYVYDYLGKENDTGELLPYISTGYILTIKDIVNIYGKAALILKVVEDILGHLYSISRKIITSEFILEDYAYQLDRPRVFTDRVIYDVFTGRKDILDILLSNDRVSTFTYIKLIVNNYK